MVEKAAKFQVGQLVLHKRFGYRGVCFDVDPVFLGSDEWYDAVARSHPPRDAPWYHVLVHDAVHTTYVAERNLEPDESTDPIRHAALDRLFEAFDAGYYRPRLKAN
jgi:heat shock protein HspQ